MDARASVAGFDRWRRSDTLFPTRASQHLLITTALIALCACATSSRPQGFVTHPPDALTSALRLERKSDVPRHLVKQEPWRSPEMMRVDSEVTLELLVDSDGAVEGSRYASGDQRFLADTSAAAQRWRFEPLLVDGKPTAFVLPVRFALNWRAAAREDILISYALPE